MPRRSSNYKGMKKVEALAYWRARVDHYVRSRDIRTLAEMVVDMEDANNVPGAIEPGEEP